MIPPTSPAASLIFDPSCPLVCGELFELWTLVEIVLDIITVRTVFIGFLLFGLRLIHQMA